MYDPQTIIGVEERHVGGSSESSFMQARRVLCDDRNELIDFLVTARALVEENAAKREACQKDYDTLITNIQTVETLCRQIMERLPTIQASIDERGKHLRSSLSTPDLRMRRLFLQLKSASKISEILSKTLLIGAQM